MGYQPISASRSSEPPRVPSATFTTEQAGHILSTGKVTMQEAADALATMLGTQEIEPYTPQPEYEGAIISIEGYSVTVPPEMLSIEDVSVPRAPRSNPSIITETWI